MTNQLLTFHQRAVIWQALTDYMTSGIYAPVNVDIAEHLSNIMLDITTKISMECDNS